jgi:catechol 2,3-dioxygenase-like lactoylglutathione lyase family enzyme
MTLRIRQIVLAARDLDDTVAQLESALGLHVVYRDPLVAEFGLHNALLAIGDQLLEVVSPLRPDTAAGRHLDRHGDSAYMLLLQTDDLARDRARLERLGVRTIWQADLPDMRATQLHPKDIGAAIVSLDQPSPAESWRWAGPDWRPPQGDNRVAVLAVSIGAADPGALAARWSQVLGTEAPHDAQIALAGGALRFERAATERITGFQIALGGPPRTLTICGTRFQLV